jgi:hypothetical protein
MKSTYHDAVAWIACHDTDSYPEARCRMFGVATHEAAEEVGDVRARYHRDLMNRVFP